MVIATTFTITAMVEADPGRVRAGRMMAVIVIARVLAAPDLAVLSIPPLLRLSRDRDRSCSWSCSGQGTRLQWLVWQGEQEQELLQGIIVPPPTRLSLPPSPPRSRGIFVSVCDTTRK